MTRLAIAALTAIITTGAAHAQPALFPAPGSYNSNQMGPYTYYNGQGWSGQSTQIGPYGYTNYSDPNGGMHNCVSNRVGQFTYNNCN